MKKYKMYKLKSGYTEEVVNFEFSASQKTEYDEHSEDICRMITDGNLYD